MREISFRGKQKDNSEWVEGSLHIEVGETDKNGKQKLDYRILGLRGECDYIFPETVGQFTGLTDKNGERIFEGDIVDILTENEEIGFVAYDDGGFLVNANGFCVDFHANINGTDLEVIGNIHDDPEMLEEENDNA